MFKISWYLRGLFENETHQKTKFNGIDPSTITDDILLDIICDLTGMSELAVVEEAKKEIQKNHPGFSWSFDEYFNNLKLQLHPLIRDELRRAFYVLQN